LATLTGLDRATISRAITDLGGRGKKARQAYISEKAKLWPVDEAFLSRWLALRDGRHTWSLGTKVIASLGTPEGHWFHAPNEWWGWGQYEELELPDSGTSSTDHDPATSP
jgi:hypothetical protein